MKRVSGSTNKDGGSDDCLLKQAFKATELLPKGFKLLLITVTFLQFLNEVIYCIRRGSFNHPLSDVTGDRKNN